MKFDAKTNSELAKNNIQDKNMIKESQACYR